MPKNQRLLALVAVLESVLAASCAHPASRRDEDVSPRAREVGPARVERGLELILYLDESERRRSWPIPVAVYLVNLSATQARAIVLPGDGSDAGWREPHVFFSAEVLADDGSWTAVPPRSPMRCGNYDPYWLKDIVRLAPRATRQLHWMGPLPVLPERGRVRLRAHYVYKATPPRRGWGAGSSTASREGLGEMEGVTPFELISAPLEVTLPVR